MSKTFAAFTACSLSTAALAQNNPELHATRGLESQLYLGTGKGVIVAVLDQGVDVKHPALDGALYSQKDFTGEDQLDDARKGPGHGTGIAGILVGRGDQYRGLAPDARLINARVDNRKDVATDLSAGAGLFWSAKKGAKVANISFGNAPGQQQLSGNFTLMCDYVAERYGVNVVVAGGNDAGSAVKQVPADQYNGYTVGAMGPNLRSAADFSNWAEPDDRRTKPDLMAPGVGVLAPLANWEKRGTDFREMTGSSFSAPMVGGVLAQMVGYGKQHDLPTDPLLLKAVLLTSAAKAYDTDGAPWGPRTGQKDKYYRRVITKPLDNEQGAGALDAVAAYRLYNKTKTPSQPVNAWKSSSLKGDDSYELSLGKLVAGQRVDATLTWFRHVTYKDRGDEGFSEDDTFTRGSLADFTLRLLKDGDVIGASDSSVDNLEHLSWRLTQAGNYSLQVYRFDEGGLVSEKFALAARVVQNGAGSLAPGGIAGVFASSPVPEPGTAGSVFVLALAGLSRRRRG